MTGKTGNSIASIVLFIRPVLWEKNSPKNKKTHKTITPPRPPPKKNSPLHIRCPQNLRFRWFKSVDRLTFALSFASLAFNLLWLFRRHIISKLMRTNLSCLAAFNTSPPFKISYERENIPSFYCQPKKTKTS